VIESIYLDNYKNFKSLQITGLKRLNIFSGQNNTGKTSILEALFMFYDRGSPDSIFKQLSLRGVNSIDLNPSSLWQPMFNDFDLSKKITMKVQGSGIEETAIYSHKNDFNTVVSSNQSSAQYAQPQSSQNLQSQSLHTKYTLRNRSSGESDLFINGGQLSLKVNNLQQAHKEVIFVPSSTKGTGPIDAERLGKIDIEGDISVITDSLKIIEPRLKGLSIIPQGQQSIIYGDIGLPKKIPISYMGEGISKLLSTLVTIASSKGGIVCLDEIENGIHYSLFPKIWEIVNDMAKKYNCQLFVTTHSHDALKGLHDFYSSTDENELSFTRLDWIKGKVVPKTYDHSMLFAAMDRDWEVR
jgi:AAA15 family ATPase/GTPase